MTLTFETYSTEIKKHRIISHPDKITYCVLGMVGECGELAEKRKKQLRGDTEVASIDDMKKEIGDVLWYAAALADELGITLEDVALANIEKIRSRSARGVTKGSGDNR